MPAPILTPLDGSPESERVLDIALPLARLLGAPLHLLWVWEGVPGMYELVTEEVLTRITNREIADREAYLLELAARRCQPAGVTATAQALVGDPAEMILETAGATGAACIAMTTHGRAGFRRWRLGSVADRVMRASPVSTVLFRPDPGVKLNPKIERILIPLDGSERGEHALAEALRLARAGGAAVHLLRAVSAIIPTAPLGMDTAYEAANRAATTAADEYLSLTSKQITDVRVETSVYTGDASTAILDAAANADLIVMASHGRGGLLRFALGSVTDSVVRGAGRPVLVVRNPADADSAPEPARR